MMIMMCYLHENEIIQCVFVSREVVCCMLVGVLDVSHISSRHVY